MLKVTWVEVKGHLGQLKGQWGQGQPNTQNIGRWAHINVKLHFFYHVQ